MVRVLPRRARERSRPRVIVLSFRSTAFHGLDKFDAWRATLLTRFITCSAFEKNLDFWAQFYTMLCDFANSAS